MRRRVDRRRVQDRAAAVDAQDRDRVGVDLGDVVFAPEICE
jgi:hypothetical protein